MTRYYCDRCGVQITSQEVRNFSNITLFCAMHKQKDWYVADPMVLCLNCHDAAVDLMRNLTEQIKTFCKGEPSDDKTKMPCDS